MNVNQPDDMTPNLAALAREVAALPFAWPDAATRSRMRSRFEDALAAKTVAKHGWLGRGFLIAAALLALGASAAAASASRSPMDLVRDPGGVVRDIIGKPQPQQPTPSSAPAVAPSATPDVGPGGDDDDRRGRDDGSDDNSSPGSGDDGPDDNSGSGGSGGSGSDGGDD